MADAPYLFFNPRKSLADVDAAGPIHGADFATAVGEGGRRQLEDDPRGRVVVHHAALRPAAVVQPPAEDLGRWGDGF